MAPVASRDDKLDRLLEAVAGIRATLDDTRETGKENQRALNELGERSATTEQRLLAVEMAQQSTAASVMNAHRMNDDALSNLKDELYKRVETLENAANAIAPTVAEATNTAAVPWRNKVAKTARQSWWMGALVVAMAVGKFFIPSAAALGTDWHIFVRSVNGVDKTLSAPQN